MTDAAAPLRRALLIANPIAGGGRSGAALDAIAAGLRRRGLEVEARRTTVRGDAARIAAAARGADLVVAMGGDGTLSEVVHGVVRSAVRPRPAVGMLPFGTGNAAVLAFELPRRIEDALDALARGRSVPVDVGHVTRDGRECGTLALWLGAGVDGAVLHAVAARRDGPLGARMLLRAPALLREATRYAFPTLEVELDGVRQPDCVQAIVCNVGETAAPGFDVAPDADPGDGQFDVLTVTRRSWPAWLAATSAVFLRRLGRVHGVRVTRASHISIRSAQPAPVHLDGDAAGHTPVDVALEPSAIRFVVPG